MSQASYSLWWWEVLTSRESSTSISMETPNSLTEIEQRQRRRVRVSIVVSAVATAVLVIMGLLLVVFAALPLSDWRTWYLYVILAVTIVIAATLPMAVARTVRGSLSSSDGSNHARCRQGGSA